MPQGLFKGTGYSMSSWFIELWNDYLTSLILDAFVLQMWATPFTTRLFDTVGTTVEWQVFIVILVAVLTFTFSLVTNINTDWLNNEVRVCESPLFRSAWLFAAMGAVTRHIGAGVLPFTIVTFLPLVYVRISPLLPHITALYATGFFVCTIILAVAGGRGHATDTSFNWGFFILDSISLTIICVHHSVWIASHDHTRSLQQPHDYQGLSGTQKLNFTDPRTEFSRILYEATRLATFRTLVVLSSMLVIGTPTHSVSFLSLSFVRTLFLLATISTSAAWTNCQHQQPTSLRNVLLATVVASSCGMLIDGTGQTAFLLIATPFAIALDIFG